MNLEESAKVLFELHLVACSGHETLRPERTMICCGECIHLHRCAACPLHLAFGRVSESKDQNWSLSNRKPKRGNRLSFSDNFPQFTYHTPMGSKLSSVHAKSSPTEAEWQQQVADARNMALACGSTAQSIEQTLRTGLRLGSNEKLGAPLLALLVESGALENMKNTFFAMKQCEQMGTILYEHADRVRHLSDRERAIYFMRKHLEEMEKQAPEK